MTLPLTSHRTTNRLPQDTDAYSDTFSPVRETLAQVEHCLQEELVSQHADVAQVVRHGYRLGGKRLRPALLLLANQVAASCDQGRAESESPVLLATVVEMIHTATLIHDDVLDEADLRRHAETVNARWGNETSVLLGDFLFSHAFYLASTTGSADACRVIGKATNRVCEGEMLQTLRSGDLSLSLDEYYQIIEAKTAELCACCCELGALHASAPDETTDRLKAYGRNLGIAFQIVDDMIDLLGNEQTTGKTSAADLAKQKLTLPLIHARDTLVNGPRTAFMTLLEQGRHTDLKQIRQITDDAGSLNFARQEANRYVEQALDAIAPLPGSSAKASLAAIAQFVTMRQA